MCHLVLVETSAQAIWIKGGLELDPQTKLVAVSAEAMQTLEELGLPHTAIADYSDTALITSEYDRLVSDTYGLVQDLESFIMNRSPDVRLEGPGFLTGQVYYIACIAVPSLATRTVLINDVVQACSPTQVSICSDAMAPWFMDENTRHNPLINVLDDLSLVHGFRLNVLDNKTSSELVSAPKGSTNISTRFWSRAYRYALRRRRIAQALVAECIQSRPKIDYSMLDGMRLLFVGGINTELKELGDILRNARQTKQYLIGWSNILSTSLLSSMHSYGRVASSASMWGVCLSSTVRDLSSGTNHEIDAAVPSNRDGEARTMLRLFDLWLATQESQPIIEISGINLFPALEQHLRRLVATGPSLARHTDSVADQVLSISQPDAVCFPGIIHLSDKRLAYKCYKLDIPVLGVQHGGTIGTVKHVGCEYNDLGVADFYLTYGDGIRIAKNPVMPTRAKLIPVGSRSLERRVAGTRLSSTRNLSRIIKVLWLSDTSFGNTRTHEFRGEETARYRLQKKCLDILLSGTNLRVTFRPLAGFSHYLGTASWLAGQGYHRVCVDEHTSLDDLLTAADVVISDSASSSVWNESIAFKTPVILYCDPSCTPLRSHFAPDVEEAFHWCKNEDEFVAAMRRLVTEGAEFVVELNKTDTSRFLEKYVLHRDDGRCEHRVISFLNSLSDNGISIEDN